MPPKPTAQTGGDATVFVASEVSPSLIKVTKLKFIDKVMTPAGSVLTNMSKGIREVTTMNDSVQMYGAATKGCAFLKMSVAKDNTPAVSIHVFDGAAEVLIAELSYTDGVVVKDAERYGKITAKLVEDLSAAIKAAVDKARENNMTDENDKDAGPLIFTENGGHLGLGGVKGQVQGKPVHIMEYAPPPKGAKKGEKGEELGLVTKKIVMERKMERLVAAGIKKDADATTLKGFADAAAKAGHGPEKAVVGFMREKREVIESAERINVLVIRTGDAKLACTVDYKTIDGKAKAGNDFKATSGTLEFAANEVQKQIEVQIIDNTELEDAEDFYMELSGGSNCEIIRSKIKLIILSDDGDMENWHEDEDEEEEDDANAAEGEGEAKPAAAEEPKAKMSMMEKAKSAQAALQKQASRASEMAASQLNKEELMKMNAERKLLAEVTKVQGEVDGKVMDQLNKCHDEIMNLNRTRHALSSHLREEIGGIYFIVAMFELRAKLAEFAKAQWVDMKLECKMDLSQLKTFKSPLVLGLKDYPVEKGGADVKACYDLVFGETGITRRALPALLVNFGILCFKMNQTMVRLNKLLAETISGMIMVKITSEVGLKAFTKERSTLRQVPFIIRDNIKNFIKLAPKLAMAFIKTVKTFVKETVQGIKAQTIPLMIKGADGKDVAKVEGVEEIEDDGDDDVLGDKFKEASADAAAASDKPVKDDA